MTHNWTRGKIKNRTGKNGIPDFKLIGPKIASIKSEYLYNFCNKLIWEFCDRYYVLYRKLVPVFCLNFKTITVTYIILSRNKNILESKYTKTNEKQSLICYGTNKNLNTFLLKHFSKDIKLWHWRYRNTDHSFLSKVPNLTSREFKYCKTFCTP